jgi:uncharacterized protein (TIGR02246 family)
MRRRFIAALIVCGFLAPPAWSQEAKSEAPDDEAALRANVTAYVEAFNKHDAAALAELWSPEAVYINRMTGEEVTGREAIAEQFKAVFAERPETKLAVDVESVRLLSPNVAVEHGVVRFMEKDQEPESINYVAVYVKREGKWLLDRVTDEASQEPPPSNYEQLQALEWLVGRWVDQDENVRIETTCNWSKNRNFLIRSFTVEAGDVIDSSGMQVVGWDPAAKQIRSWTFDSDGGFAEAVWTKRGEQWFIENKGVLADGRRASMVNVMKPIDANSFTWQTVERTAGSELLPNVNPVLIVRE